MRSFRESAVFVFSLSTLCVLLLAAASAPERAAVHAMDRDLADRVTKIATSKMDELHSPGLGVGVVYGHTLAYEGYFGYENLAAGEEVTEDTVFRIGSISKGVTAIGLMRQWEKGEFELDDPVNDYLPEKMIHSPDPAKPVTFRHLLTHTSGGGEFLSFKQLLMKGQGVQVEGDDYEPLYHYLRLGFDNKIEPGVKYAYSNYGYSFIGLALEQMAGEPFAEHMEAAVFEPLGMEVSTFEHTEAMEERIITGYGYKKKSGEYVEKQHRPFGITPSGNVYTTVREFGLYVAALLNGGANRNGRVVSEDTLSMMMKRQHAFDPRQAGYGFGFRVYSDDLWGERIVGHSGSVPFGYTAQMALAPDARIGVYVFANSDSHAPKKIGFEIMRELLGGEEVPLPNVEPDRSAWPELAGYYGPEHRDFKTSTRIYMSGVGTYRVEAVDDELLMYGTWQGREEARRLYQVEPGDPRFFRIEPEPADEVPEYVSFYERDGRLYMSPGGFDEYVRLRPARAAKIKTFVPLGRLIAGINPF